MNVDEMQEIALAIAGAALNMDDEEVRHFHNLHGVDGLWHLGLDIAEQGPQNDMERRILGEALVRRLEGK